MHFALSAGLMFIITVSLHQNYKAMRIFFFPLFVNIYFLNSDYKASPVGNVLRCAENLRCVLLWY